jgi:hypothetical protein
MENKTIFVTSTNRDRTKDPYGNSYTLYLSTPIKDITSVEILYASVPNTMFNLTECMNVISFNSNTYTIPEGFYGSGGLASEIQCAEVTTEGVSIGYLPNEGKYLFTSTCPFTMNVLSEQLASMLGVPYGTELCSTHASHLPYMATNTRYMHKWFIRSSNIIDLNVNEGVFLDIHELRTNFNECAAVGRPFSDSSSQTASRSFGFIPMNVSSGCIKVFTPKTDFDNVVDYVYPLQKLDRLTVNWIDKNGKLLNFNGMNDNSFILRFHTLRRNLRDY